MERRNIYEKALGPAIISEPTRIREDERIPEGYELFERSVRLLNDRLEPAYYSKNVRNEYDIEAWNRLYDALKAGFIWVLTTPEFLDGETADDDRTQEIGNMMSFAIAEGLSEEEVVACYKWAFEAAKTL